MTDLSASNDVIIILSRIYWRKQLKFLHFYISFLDLFSTRQLQLKLQLLDFSNYNGTAGASKHFPDGDACRPTFVYIITSSSNFIESRSSYYFQTSLPLINYCDEPTSLFGVFIHGVRCFLCEALIRKSSPAGNNNPAILNSKQLSGAMVRETITISSVASPEPRIVKIDSDSNEPTISYGFGSQHPIVPPSLIDLNLPLNSFNVLAIIIMTVIRADEEYSPNHRSHLSSLPSLRPQWLWAPLKARRQRTQERMMPDFSPRMSPASLFGYFFQRNFLCIDVSIGSSPSSKPPPPRRQKKKLNIGISFPKKWECHSTPASHAARGPYQQKDTLMLKKNSNIKLWIKL